MERLRPIKLRRAPAQSEAWRQGGDFEAKQIRIVPDPKGTRIHVVCSTPDVHPEGSFLWELARRHPEEWAKRRGDVDMMSAWVRELASTQTWNPDRVTSPDREGPAAWISENFGALGIDPGVSNVACVASTSGALQVRQVEQGYQVARGDAPAPAARPARAAHGELRRGVEGDGSRVQDNP